MIIGKLIQLDIVSRNDLDFLQHIRNNPENWNCFFNHRFFGLDNQEKWYESIIQNSTKILFIIRNKQTQEKIGCIGLDDIDHVNQKAEYGQVLITKECRNSGYGLEAATLLVEYSFRELNLRKLYLVVFSHNNGALSFFEKVGFVEEGLLKQHIYKGGKFRDVSFMGVIRKEVNG